MHSPLLIDDFINLAKTLPVIDVRSPGEFEHGHIPGAHNIPLFDNEERAKVGTAYKQIGRQKAIEIGFELVGPKLKSFIENATQIVSAAQDESLSAKYPTVLVHCWRGGMRSANFAHLLNVYGYKTHTLLNGYKAYRNHVLSSFDKDANLLIIGGETGSGKTEILKKISETGEQVIDLEAIAHHKGSAFGSLGEQTQPTQEQFENELSLQLSKLDLSKRIWLEDESRNTGRCQIPPSLWGKMKQAPLLHIRIPKKLRIERLVADYGAFSAEELKGCLLKIEQRLGGQHLKRALEELANGNLQEVADVALTYYDKAYNYQLENRKMKNTFLIESEVPDPSANAKKIMEYADSWSLQKQSN